MQQKESCTKFRKKINIDYMKRITRKYKWWPIGIFIIIIMNLSQAQAQQFEAIGPLAPTELGNDQPGVVIVNFDLLPTTMSFDVPWHYCMVTENGIKIAYFAPETYDPRNWNAGGFLASFEVGMDDEARYLRIWIEYASDARIVVRIRYALCNAEYDIAHADIANGSPLGDGKGDWGEEWYYIYPDGTYVRHIKLYTGLASMSLPFGFNREPPMVVHEFMESVIISATGQVPSDVINIDCLKLFKMFGDHTGDVIPEGVGTTISYNPCPDDYGNFKDANIMLLNPKSEYKPFTIGLPYGVRTQPYTPENGSPYPWESWESDYPGVAYISAIGHMLNYWHFRRTETTLEQVYLHGMTNAADPQAYLIDLAWSWIGAPRLQMAGLEYDYFNPTYDQTQKAYIVPHDSQGPDTLDFTIYKYENMNAPMNLVNPAFIVKNWNDTINEFILKVDDLVLNAGTDYRFGFEQTDSGNDLIIWLPINTKTSKHVIIEPAK
jgi:hypothetical protein